jgi:hypothetical protein
MLTIDKAMPRFLVETIDKNNGDLYYASTMDEDQLKEKFPDIHQAIAEDVSCVGAIDIRRRLPHVAIRITDRDRYPTLEV